MAATMLFSIRSSIKSTFHRLSHKSSKPMPPRRLSIVFENKTKFEPRVEPKVQAQFKPKVEAEIEIVAPAPDPVKITISVNVPAKFKPSKRSLKITDLPNDIILMIFDLLVERSFRKTSATCFGLSHPQFYPLLKLYVSIPIGLKENYEIIRGGLPGSPSVLSLSAALIDFMGPEYRIGRYTKKFLARSVYGDIVGPLELELDRRYYAYTDTVQIIDKEESRGRKHYSIRRFVLPNPYGMGKEWYQEALKVKNAADKSGLHLVSYMDEIGYCRGVSWTFVE